MMEVHAPKNTIHRIDSIWAYVSVDPKDSTEGVCAFWTREHGHMPMIAADEARLVQLTPIAHQIAKETGITIKLIRLTTREEIETITP